MTGHDPKTLAIIAAVMVFTGIGIPIALVLFGAAAGIHSERQRRKQEAEQE